MLTTSQAGDLLGVTGQTIKNWVRDRRIKGFRVGGRIMVPRDGVVYDAVPSDQCCYQANACHE